MCTLLVLSLLPVLPCYSVIENKAVFASLFLAVKEITKPSPPPCGSTVCVRTLFPMLPFKWRSLLLQRQNMPSRHDMENSFPKQGSRITRIAFKSSNKIGQIAAALHWNFMANRFNEIQGLRSMSLFKKPRYLILRSPCQAGLFNKSSFEAEKGTQARRSLASWLSQRADVRRRNFLWKPIRSRDICWAREKEGTMRLHEAQIMPS